MVWTTAEGLGVTVRLAVHAIRRIDRGTVLDFSVTPLTARDLAVGDRLPAWVDLGLTREFGGDNNIFLLDPGRSAVYRPVSHTLRSEFNRCLCSPLWVAQLSLRIGETRMLQVTYPPVPESVRFLDVSMVTVPLFAHVPVTPKGRVPTATGPTDLARPAEQPAAVAEPVQFRYPPPLEQRSQSIQVVSISSTATMTSMRWNIRSLTDQPNFNVVPGGPPVSAELPADVNVFNPGSAYGPILRVAGHSTRALFMTTRVQGRGFFECLCTDLGLWATSLRRPGGQATVTTTYPPLPAGTRAVDVILPGVATLRGLPVVPAADAAIGLGPEVPAGSDTWRYSESAPPPGWSTYDWPTPTPDPDQLEEYETFVEDVVRLPGW